MPAAKGSLSSSVDFAFSTSDFFQKQTNGRDGCQTGDVLRGLGTPWESLPSHVESWVWQQSKVKEQPAGELDCSLFVWSITEAGDSIHIAPSIEDKYLAWKSSLDVCSLALIRDTAGLV